MPAANFSVEQLITLKRVTSIAPAPDGRWLAVAVQRLDRDGVKYVSDLWKVPTDGGAPVQLTRGDSKDASPWFRHDGSLGFLSNRQPNEVKPDEDAEKRMQVWILPAEGGEPQQLTDEPLGVESFRFARSAPRLALFAPVLTGVEHDRQRETAAERRKKQTSARHFRGQPVRHWDHWLHENDNMANTHLVVYAADGTQRMDLTPDARRELAIEPGLDVSADGSQVAATWQTVGADRELDSTIRLFDVAARTVRTFGAAPNTSNESPLFSPDGKTLAVVRSARSATQAIRPALTLIDLASGALREIGRAFDAWPMPGDWTADGRQIVFSADLDGHVPVFSVDVTSEKVTRLTVARSAGSHSDLRVLADGRIVGIRSTFREPPEAFVVTNAPDSPPQTLARLSGFAFPDWAEVEHCSTPSTDGTPIQYFVTRPAKAQGKVPTLLWIHGGPIGMTGDGWHWRWNPLLAVAAGYAVVQPNARGSTGFGQEFVQGIWGNVWGKQCYEDLMAVTDAIEKRPDVDADRIMAMGGSFGGYMTNWIGTQTQRFKCLITHACVTTMAQFTGTTDHPAWWYLEMGGENPYANPDSFDRYAPIRHVTQWKTPALIIHGELDYRCPISEGLNLFEALQYHGVPSELLVFPDENHWILKPRNIVAWYETVLAFIGRHLKAA
ncbi:MAG TPA: S9 family peptidase [Burkholderiaceae bacterium]|nr:S9 family peptidase [Burkholderiaceae bacterium]HQR69753.1 S9 family peptidase [Burkholderiaceae bacterium]